MSEEVRFTLRLAIELDKKVRVKAALKGVSKHQYVIDVLTKDTQDIDLSSFEGDSTN